MVSCEAPIECIVAASSASSRGVYCSHRIDGRLVAGRLEAEMDVKLHADVFNIKR